MVLFVYFGLRVVVLGRLICVLGSGYLWLMVLLYVAGLGCFVGFVAFGLGCVVSGFVDSVQLLVLVMLLIKFGKVGLWFAACVGCFGLLF